MKKGQNSKFVLILVLCLALFLVGCKKNDEKETATNSTSNEEIIRKYIEEQDENIKVEDLKITTEDQLEHGMILSVTFQNNGKPYFGAFETHENSDESSEIKETTKNKDDLKNEKNYKYFIANGVFSENVDKPFMKYSLSGVYTNNGEDKKTYSFEGGIVNDSRIKNIILIFNDNSIVNLKVSDEKVYNYLKKEKFVSLKSVEGLDEENNTIYAYSQ